jgi:hypothetical protein
VLSSSKLVLTGLIFSRISIAHISPKKPKQPGKMSVTDVTPALEQLDKNLDELEEALKPLLRGVSDISAKLPLLDQAKLNVLACYSLESVLFCECGFLGDLNRRPTNGNTQQHYA